MNQNLKFLIVFNSRVKTDFTMFKEGVDIILTNGLVPEVEGVSEKVFFATCLEQTRYGD